MTSFDPVDQLLFCALLDWALEILRTDRDCCHAIPVPDQQAGLSLRLLTDASHCGAAYVLQFSPLTDDRWYTIYQDIWFWKRVEMSHHCNRLEGSCLFRGLRTCSKFIEFQRQCGITGQYPPVTLAATTDSATAMSWALNGTQSQGYEGRAIERLSDGLRAETYHLRTLCDFSLSHISGADNGTADTLSRLLERSAGEGTDTLASLLRRRMERQKRAKTTVDQVRRVIDADALSSLAEECVKVSYDFYDGLDRFAFLRRVFEVWREGRVVEQPLELPLYASDEDRTLFFRCIQTCLSDKEIKKLVTHNPITKTADGILRHVRILYDGSTERAVFIPKSATFIQKSIVRHFHRKSYHRGVQYVSSSIRGFFLEGLVAAVKSVLKCCLRCAIKNASARWALVTYTEPRELELPPYSRIAIDFLHLGKLVCLTVMCIDTGVLSILTNPGNTTSTECALYSLSKLSNRFNVRIRVVRCDQAACFTSPQFKNGLINSGHQDVEVNFTVPEASYTNSVERLHREANSIIRTAKFTRLMNLELQNQGETQDQLDRISNVVNLRPIGRYIKDGQDDILTPAALAFGGHGQVSRQLIELRKFFYDRCFELLRRRHHLSNLNSKKRVNVIVGQKALYYKKTDKLSPQFSVCTIVDIQGSYIVIKLRDKELKVASNTLAPLEYIVAPDVNPQDVSRTGARISYQVGETTFTGIVVQDLGDQCEVQWDSQGDLEWNNELVDWGACRIV